MHFFCFPLKLSDKNYILYSTIKYNIFCDVKLNVQFVYKLLKTTRLCELTEITKFHLTIESSYTSKNCGGFFNTTICAASLSPMNGRNILN